MERERLDENAARSAFARLGDLHTDMGVAMLRARHETRAVLTPEQRQKLPRGGMGMHGMMGGLHGMDGMMDDMRDCPIMNGMGGMPMNGAETKSTHP